MSKLPQKECPRCGDVLVRIYCRTKTEASQPYMPIGYMCPVCRENMFVLDAK